MICSRIFNQNSKQKCTNKKIADGRALETACECRRSFEQNSISFFVSLSIQIFIICRKLNFHKAREHPTNSRVHVKTKKNKKKNTCEYLFNLCRVHWCDAARRNRNHSFFDFKLMNVRVENGCRAWLEGVVQLEWKKI